VTGFFGNNRGLHLHHAAFAELSYALRSAGLESYGTLIGVPFLTGSTSESPATRDQVTRSVFMGTLPLNVPGDRRRPPLYNKGQTIHERPFAS
jgi:hypothetical protein